MFQVLIPPDWTGASVTWDDTPGADFIERVWPPTGKVVTWPPSKLIRNDELTVFADR